MNNHVLRNVFLLSVILPTICSAYAVNQPSYHTFGNFNPCLHGFYVGATAAATSNTINNQLTFDPIEVEDAYLYNRHQYGNVTQVQPGFLIGYEYIMNNIWLVSGEFQANYLRSYLNLSSADYLNNVVVFNNQYALQLRGGFSLTSNCDNFIYGLAGVSLSQTNVKAIFNNANDNVGNLGELQMQSINSSHDLSGFKLGVGYEKCLTQHLSLRLDYSHTQYDNFNDDLLSSEFFEVMDPLGNSDTKQSVDMLGLSLIFKI